MFVIFFFVVQIGNGCYRPMGREQKKILVDETTVLWCEEKINRKKPIQPTASFHII